MSPQATIDDTRVAELGATLSGQLLRPGDASYDHARKVHNGMIDRRPALIARCQGTADIIDAVRFARDAGLDIAVRGGGHNVAGNAVCDDGLMIDLSSMKGIHVDPVARTVRAQGGVTWGEFNRETQAHGLAVTGGVISSTGIGGLTLGGGLGWLMGKYGMAVDNLLEVELVTARGEVLTVSAGQHADLLWGLRGGGGNFGVAASLLYRLHPVGPMVTSGIIAYPIDRAADVLRFYRDLTAAGIPDELVMFAGLLHAPDGSGMPLVAMAVCHCGPLADGEAALQPVKSFGTPLLDVIGPQSYSATNMMLDDGFPKGALNYWKSSFLTELSDAAIDTMVDQFSTCPSPMSSLLLEHFHGAATRVGVGETAFPHRQAGYNLVVISEWTDPSASDENVAWARSSYAAMQPHMAQGRYVNYMPEEEGEDPVRAAYGPNYDRLRALKKQYDPENLFHYNQNIRPA